MIGKDAIITKAVIFSTERHAFIPSSNVYKVELESITSFSEAIARISEVLELKTPNIS